MKIHKLKNSVSGNSKPFLISNIDVWVKLECKERANNILVTDKWKLVTCKKCLRCR